MTAATETRETVPDRCRAISQHGTVRGISMLLKQAGFPRSSYGDKGVMWNMASPGWSVWRTYHAGHPEQPYVCVQHVIGEASAACTDEEWAAYLKECRERLEQYAVPVREAGYAAVVRDRGKEPPWLTILTVVTAREELRPP